MFLSNYKKIKLVLETFIQVVAIDSKHFIDYCEVFSKIIRSIFSRSGGNWSLNYKCY